ncbi:MAG: lamin tail domain-containing protein [Planctomycetales bacterium]|nr:lamin tail domain-containing protein [Planctomycetales bacterium]
MVRQWNRMVTVGCAVATGCLMIGCRVLLLPESAWGELQVTEIMFNPKNADTDWEWVEIRNAGTVAVDLDNYWFDDVGPAAIAGSVPHIRHIAGGGKAVNTVIPAGQVAVLYDGAAVDFNDDEFRANWDMAANTHLIAVEFFPSLNNLSSTNPTETFAIWSDETAYRMDTADVSTTEVPRINVVQTSSALLSFTYDRDTFPSSNNVASIYWTGVGDGTKGENWLRSEPGQDGAITSLDMTTTGRSPLNSADDLGSPGEVPFGSFADGVSITEIMYNPRSG